ncbi:MAG: hypothetical protein RLQ25_04320 [Alphaproteobacteria bacterium]
MSDVHGPLPARLGGTTGQTGGMRVTFVSFAGGNSLPGSVGEVLSGTVMGRDNQGHTLIRTSQGQLTINTSLNLPEGATVRLQVQIVGAQTHLVLLSVNQQALSQSRLATPPLAATSGGTTPPTPASVTQTPPSVGPGSPVLSGHLLANTGGPGASVAAPVAGTSTNPTTLDSTNALRLRLLAVAYAGSGLTRAQMPQSLLQGDVATLSGEVIGRDSNSAQVRTAAGVIILSGNHPLTNGQRVLLQLLPGQSVATGPAVAGAAAAGTHAPLQSLAHPGSLAASAWHTLAAGWPAMRDTLSILTAADSGASAHLLSTVLPQPGPRFTPQILALISALVQGDFSRWFGGRASEALGELGRGDLISRLDDDFGQLARLAGPRSEGDWRTFLLPVFYDGAFHPARLSLHRRGKGKRVEDGSQRFLVEVTLSALGQLQLDGLVHKRHLDLMVRTATPLSEAIRTDLRAIYASAMEEARFSGVLRFNAGSGFPSAAKDSPPVLSGLTV